MKYQLENGEVYIENGVYHREGGPAIITYGRIIEFYYWGKLHNEVGPARLYLKQQVAEWWLNGIKISEGHIIDNAQWNKLLL